MTINAKKRDRRTIFLRAISTKSLMPSSGSSSDGCCECVHLVQEIHICFWFQQIWASNYFNDACLEHLKHLFTRNVSVAVQIVNCECICWWTWMKNICKILFSFSWFCCYCCYCRYSDIYSVFSPRQSRAEKSTSPRPIRSCSHSCRCPYRKLWRLHDDNQDEHSCDVVSNRKSHIWEWTDLDPWACRRSCQTSCARRRGTWGGPCGLGFW